MDDGARSGIVNLHGAMSRDREVRAVRGKRDRRDTRFRLGDRRDSRGRESRVWIRGCGRGACAGIDPALEDRDLLLRRPLPLSRRHLRLASLLDERDEEALLTLARDDRGAALSSTEKRFVAREDELALRVVPVWPVLVTRDAVLRQDRCDVARVIDGRGGRRLRLVAERGWVERDQDGEYEWRELHGPGLCLKEPCWLRVNRSRFLRDREGGFPKAPQPSAERGIPCCSRGSRRGLRSLRDAPSRQSSRVPRACETFRGWSGSVSASSGRPPRR